MRKWLIGLLLLLLVGVPVLLMQIHFGPRSQVGSPFVVAKTTLGNGSEVYVALRRTGEWIDAYESALIEVDSAGRFWRYYLGHEDGYWWGAGLIEEPSKRHVRIISFWNTVAVLDLDKNEIVWRGDSRPRTPRREVGANYWSIPTKNEK